MTACDIAKNELVGTADRVLAPTYVRPGRVFVEGEGSWLVDEDGNRFLDMTSGIAVCALGHGSPIVRRAIEKAAGGLVHTSNLFHTAPAIGLAEALVSRSFAKSVFFANSGAEANEGAIKFARLAAEDGRREILYSQGSFHGRTLGTLAVTDRPDYREPFEPLPGGTRSMAWNDHDALELIDDRTAAVIVEPIQGESGIRVPDEAWLRALRARCDERGALLVFDEVQCGLGRTGKLWGHEHFGVEPDIMTLAKPLGGGLPIGAVLLGEKAARAVRPSCHATTFGGGPLVTAVARAVFDTVSAPEFLEGVKDRGRRLREGLEAIDHADIIEVRGRGLMLGVKLRDPARVRKAAEDAGLLLVPAGDDVLRFLPPLNVPISDLDEALRRFEAALRSGSDDETRS